MHDQLVVKSESNLRKVYQPLSYELRDGGRGGGNRKKNQSLA